MFLPTRPLRGALRIVLSAAVLVWLSPITARAEKVDIVREKAGFSLEFRDAEIKDALRAIGQAMSLNLVVSDAVTGQVSLSLKDVEIWDALESILRIKGLTYVRESNIVRIMPVAEVRDEDMETRVFPLGYANSKDVLALMERIKSDRAKISMDARLNMIVAKDLSINIDNMERLIRNLDSRIPQVSIEAKIVEVASSYTQEFGIQWGGKYTSGNGKTTITGGASGVSSSGGSAPAIGSSTLYPLTGDIGLSGNGYVVNLPAAVGSGSGGALGATFGTVSGKLTLDLQLSAMQSTGNGKILSNPKVVTLNNREAKISSGVDIPVKVLTTTTAGATADLKTIAANLTLSTVPQITSDNRIAMTIKVEKAEPDYSQIVDGLPTISRRNASTEVVVGNGETLVIGGIYSKNEAQSEAGIPFLSKIPLLGWLFKKKSSYEKQDELLIFITPSIMKD